MNPRFCTWGATALSGLAIGSPILPGYTPGGSSGSSATAVVIEIVPFAQNNDGMGSSCTPTAYCELSTLRTIPGIVPGRVGSNDWYGMFVQGVLTVNNEDLYLITKTLTNGIVDAEDPMKALPENFTASVNTTAPTFGLKAVPEYIDAAQQTTRAFADKDFTVTEKNVPYPLSLLPMPARWTTGVAD